MEREISVYEIKEIFYPYFKSAYITDRGYLSLNLSFSPLEVGKVLWKVKEFKRLEKFAINEIRVFRKRDLKMNLELNFKYDGSYLEEFLFQYFSLLIDFLWEFNKDFYFSIESGIDVDIIFWSDGKAISFLDLPSPKVLFIYIVKFYSGLLVFKDRTKLVIKEKEFKKEERKVKDLKDFIVKHLLFSIK